MKAMTVQQAAKSGFLFEQADGICSTNDDMTYDRKSDSFLIWDDCNIIMKLPAKVVKTAGGKVKVYDFTELFESVRTLNNELS